MFFTTLKNSLAYRLPPVYRFLLSYKTLKNLPAKPEADLTLLTMTGSKFLEFTRLSLYSLANSWSKIPSLVVVNDGTAKDDEIRKALQFWPASLDIESWTASVEQHKKKQRLALCDYAVKDAFGKKMSAILAHCRNRPVLWMDSDIIFFKDFTHYIPTPPGQWFCGGTEDWISFYDERLIESSLLDLSGFERFNAGLIYCYGSNLYEEHHVEQMITVLQGNYRLSSEQTIFAWLARQSLGKVWKNDVLENKMNDRQHLRPGNTPVARHYTSNVRHLFWRDCFFLLK